MALEMKKDSKNWYARFYIDGKAKVFNLEIPIKGERPASLKRGPFDPLFLESKGRAQQEHDRRKAEILRPKQPEEYVQRLHELRTGQRIESIALGVMQEEWEALPRKRRVAKNYLDTGRTRIGRFVAYVTEQAPKVATMADVSPELARGFMKHEEANGISGRTYNGVLGLLKSTFHHLAHKGNILHNPFDGIPTKEMDTVHRQPFSEEELQAILAATAKRPFLAPVVITGVCTAMRLGDCCCLRWDAVDLEQRFVTVKTSKTGESVDIPMFPMLHSLLSKQPEGESEFAFPEQAAMYRSNRSGLSYRIRKLFEAAGFYDKPKDEDGASDQEEAALPPPPANALERVTKAIEGLTDAEMVADKKERVLAACRLFLGGKSVTETADALGFGKSSVSEYLREVRRRVGFALRAEGSGDADRPEHRGDVRMKRDARLKRATIRDFHSFRVTWITLALSAGVPLELVQRVTGHRTTDVVLKHYFRPGRAAFKQAIENAMPKLLMEPLPADGEQAVEGTVVAESVEGHTEQPGPGELLEQALVEMAAVKSTSQHWAQAVELVGRAKAWVDQPSPTTATA